MPPKGVTLDEVASVMEQLKAQGLTPTVRRVREELGTGSSTTITKHMSIIRVQKNPPVEVGDEEIPDDVSNLFKAIGKQVWLATKQLAESEARKLKQQIHEQAYGLAEQHELLQETVGKIAEYYAKLHDIGDGNVD